MNIEIICNDSIAETKVTIYTNKISQEIENLRQTILSSYSTQLVAFKDDFAFPIEFKDILRIYSEDKAIFVETISDKYKSKQKLYVLEQILPKDMFCQISRSEIINLKFIKKLDLSYFGSIVIEFKNGAKSFVSRRCISKFKKILNI